MRLPISLVLALVLTGCVSGATLEAVFDPSAAAIVLAAGERTIKGQASLKRSDGTLVFAGGNKVRLLADTPYQRSRMQTLYGDARTAYAIREIPGTPADYGKYSRDVVADAEGRFEFTGITAGKYIVTTKVVWPEGGGVSGGFIYTVVDVTDKDELALVLNGE